ncbi:MAG: hypothetical protein UV60_C0034G0006 [Parcubacteria group bacterium GW2011_GWA2_43_11]|nr:MAG: hypothetical protein UV60_C0034G0006 [Parcubacteria group bacterium GW2011_GWA2_43_11]
MKKILATLIAVVFLVVGFSQASYAHDRNYYVLDAALNQRQPQRRIQPSYNSGYSGYGHQPSNSPEQERAMQHQMAEARYQECLGQREIDIRYGVPQDRAKDCSRLDPRNLDWSR